MTRKFCCGLVGAHVLALAMLSYHAFRNNFGNLAFGGDGGQEIISIMHQWTWSPLALGFYSNPFQGLGDVWFNINAKLIPSYLLPLVFVSSERILGPEYIVLCYVFLALELFLATVLLSRVLGFDWISSLAAGWLLPLLTLPFIGYSRLFPFTMNSPCTSTILAEFALLVAVICRLGSGADNFNAMFRRTLMQAAAIIFLIILLVASQPLRVFLWLPVLLIVSLALILAAAKKERLLKCCVLFTVGLVILISGPGSFLYGMFNFTAAKFWTGELENVLTQPELVSIWYGNSGVGPMGPTLFTFGIVGMLIALAIGDRRIRFLSGALLISVALIHLLGYAALTWKFWRGPAPIYFEFLLWPFYVLFGVFGVVQPMKYFIQVLSRFSAHLRSLIEIPPLLALANVCVLLAIPCYVLAFPWATNNPKRMFPLPPSKPPMIAFLELQLGLRPGEPFRGRVATMELIARTNSVGWMDIVNKDWPRYAATGNEYHWNGIWSFDVPTLFEYTASMSPAYFRAVTRMLGVAKDRQIRNTVVLRRADAHALGIFGVRYIISDASLSDPFKLVMIEPTHDGEVLYLYEVPLANFGIHSPTVVKVATGFDDALVELDDPNFDESNSVLVFDAALAKTQLVRSDTQELRMEPGGYRVKATSPGTSVLVLPFEFSHCLRARGTNTKNGEPRIVRVNAMKTGLVFERSVDMKVEYFAGLFDNTFCRNRDASEFGKLTVESSK